MIKVTTTALALHPKGETYRRMGDHLLAVETLNLATKANPKLAFAWQVRSLAKQLDPTIK